MGKFSITGEEEDEEEYINHSPKRRKRRCIPNPNIFQSFSSISSPTAPFISQIHHSCDSSVGPTSSKSFGPVSVILSDPDVLDCSICFDPLTIPVFQCDNGHIACSSCCKSLGNKCPSCSGKIGNNRCRAIEKVIESVQIPCCYSRQGCQETMSYCKKREHEEKCTYAPFSCPFPDCDFQGSPRRLSHHVGKDHSDHVIQFRYDSVFSVPFKFGFDVLREEREGTLFVLSCEDRMGIRCADRGVSNGMFGYDLVMRKGYTCIKFQSMTQCTTGRLDDPLRDDYIRIPEYFSPIDEGFELQVCIRSKDATSCTNIT